MFNVFWMNDLGPQNKFFNTTEMREALTFMEKLRACQRSGEDISFVTFCSENPNSVGDPGVDVTGPDYNWKKRRI